MVYILLGNGFEEMEAIGPADLLRRAGIDVALVGLEGQTVTGGQGISVVADCTLEQVDLEQLEMLVIPGGLGGVNNIRNNIEAQKLIQKVYAKGRYLAAICAGPMILAEQGFLDRRSATCYPGMEEQMGSTVIASDANIVIDGRIITGKAPGTAIEFGLALIRTLRGTQAARAVQNEIHYDDC